MGLDAWLVASKPKTENAEQSLRDLLKKVASKDKGIDFDKDEGVIICRANIAYWRKFNALHKWFRDNCANGDEEADSMPVSPQQLQELFSVLDKLKKELRVIPGLVTTSYVYQNGVKKAVYAEGKTIENPELAKQLLPTCSGFFFGSTDYDGCYYEDICDALTMLSALFSVNGWETFDYSYEASW